MNSREATEKWEAEKKALLGELATLTREERIDLIQKAREYRSSSDSFNSVYMGILATSMLRHALATGDTWAASLEKSTDKQLASALDVCANVIKYMREHPTTTCPAAGR